MFFFILKAVFLSHSLFTPRDQGIGCVGNRSVFCKRQILHTDMRMNRWTDGQTNGQTWCLCKIMSKLGLDNMFSSRYNMYSIQDLADMIHIQYATHVHDLRFQNQEFWISTSEWECFGLIQWIQQILVLKKNDHLCSVYHSFIHTV